MLPILHKNTSALLLMWEVKHNSLEGSRIIQSVVIIILIKITIRVETQKVKVF